MALKFQEKKTEFKKISIKNPELQKTNVKFEEKNSRKIGGWIKRKIFGKM